MKIEYADILIVGAGAAGAAAAWNLSKTKSRIVCLEQGPLLKKSDYSFNNPKREINKLYKFNSDPNFRNYKQDYPIDNKNSPISIANFNAVGGSTLIYSGHYPRFHPSDFKTQTLDGVSKDWLFSYYDLEKYYNLNDKIMGVSGLSGDPAYPKIENLNEPIEIGYSGKILAKSFNKLGWHWWPSYSAVKNSRRHQKGLRPTVVETYLKKAQQNGIILKENSTVLKIKMLNQTEAAGVIYADKDKNKIFLKSSIILLAANGIGTPRILMNSANKDYPNGLCNKSRQLGRNLMLHPLGFIEGRFNKYLASNEGVEGCSIFSHEFYETKKNREFKRGYTIQHLRSPGPIETYYYLKKFRKIKLGNNFFKNFFDYYGKSIQLAVICEDFADQNNKVELDFKKKDQSGMPGVKISYNLSKNSKKMLTHGINQCKRLLKCAGAVKIDAFGPVRNTGWHLIGTARMGNSPKNSVVNKFGKSHDVKNLFIIDSSIFPSSSGVNIASTIQAVSLMITDEIKKHVNLWKK